MPRSARKPSATGIFHVVQRGLDQQVIFRDDEDRRKYLSILRDCRELCGFELYAYCLLDDHIHLLLRLGDTSLESVFKRVGCRFVYWYNLRHRRSGPLFQGRFLSEPVEDELFFLSVLRYIHQQPVRAGLTASPENYRWSSYFSYAGWPDGMTDVSFALSLFPDRASLLSCLNEPSEDRILDAAPSVRTGRTEEEARALMTSLCGSGGPADFRQLPRAMQSACLRQLSGQGVSLRQLAALTGYSHTTVARLMREA